MHDPDFQLFEIHAPVPVERWKVRGEANGLTRRRYTGGGSEYVGKPMRPVWRPDGWNLVLFGRRIGWWNVLEVWHSEPGGRDSGTVCKGHQGSQLTWHNVKWGWRHRDHLRVICRPVARVRSWITLRCAGCGKRFRWKGDARFSLGWDSRETYHDPCHQLVHVRRQLDELTKYVQFDSDETMRWRVERRLAHVADKASGAAS